MVSYNIIFEAGLLVDSHLDMVIIKEAIETGNYSLLSVLLPEFSAKYHSELMEATT